MTPKPELERAIRNSGHNLTRQRQAILDALRSTKSHPTALELFDIVREHMPNITLATVYRNLGVLRELGLAQELGGEFQASRYDAVTECHPHVRCIRCGRTDDIECDEPPNTDRQAQKHTDFVITGHSLIFEGLCPKCQAQASAPNTERPSGKP